MAGEPASGAGLHSNTCVGGSAGSISNSFSSVIDRVFALLTRNRDNNEIIDHAVLVHEVPTRSQELPLITKKLDQIRNDIHLLAAFMVLMISVKGWFSDGDSKVLNNQANEVGSIFCSAPGFITEQSSSVSVISTIISRFYPKLKSGHIFVSLEVKPGFDAYVGDFHISSNMKFPRGETIRLFVAQTNCIETSSCLVTPPKAVFLINGKGVESRSNANMDTGPQLPTNVSKMMRFGPNLLQAVGEFNGNYIIAVAVMSGLPNPDSNTLQDYEQCAPSTVDADSDVIEGSSRISLNCPISFKRIKIPVKGHSCKHFQCFDFDNYVNMNSRRPSWRCPHCSMHVCFPDIRIDQKMVKVLQDVGPNVSDVIFCSDGSWRGVINNGDAKHSSDDNGDSKHNSEDNVGQNESMQPIDILDLTENDDADDVPATESGKHSLAPSGAQMSDYWSRMLMSTLVSGPSNVQPASFTLDRATEALDQSGYPSTSNEYGRFPSNRSRTPSPVMSPSAIQWNSVNNLNPFILNSLSATSNTASNSIASRGAHQQNFPLQPAGRSREPHQNTGSVNQNLVPNMHRFSNASTRGNFSTIQTNHSLSTQQMAYLRANRAMDRPPVMIPTPTIQPSSSRFLHPQNTSAQHSHVMSAAPGGDQRGVIASQPIDYDPADGSWHHQVGRMRGALTGQAYQDAFNQHIIRPNPQTQASTRPTSHIPQQVQNVQVTSASFASPIHVMNQVQTPMASGPVPPRNSIAQPRVSTEGSSKIR